MTRRSFAVAAILVQMIAALFGAQPAAAAAAPPGGNCQFILGFKALHDAIPATVGNCLENERGTATGDRVQQTTNGQLVWRKADNWTAFTNGWQTWLKGPFGIQNRANEDRFPWEGPLQSATGAATPGPNKGIFVSLGTESMIAYEDGKLVLKTPVTTGGPDSPTPLGLYTVLQKRSDFTMKSSFPETDPRWYPDSWVNFALLFQSQGYFIHDAPWRAIYGPGSNLLVDPVDGWAGSHGCVNVPYDAEAKLFAWASVGTRVWVVP